MFCSITLFASLDLRILVTVFFHVQLYLCLINLQPFGLLPVIQDGDYTLYGKPLNPFLIFCTFLFYFMWNVVKGCWF